MYPYFAQTPKRRQRQFNVNIKSETWHTVEQKDKGHSRYNNQLRVFFTKKRNNESMNQHLTLQIIEENIKYSNQEVGTVRTEIDSTQSVKIFKIA